jgi:TRAP-type C4-dicarboxylate transport system permease small subunit
MNGSGGGLLEKLNGRASLWLARLAALILVGIGIMTFCDVFARYFLNRPFTFTVEVTELLMGMVIWLGIGLTTHETRHITVDVVTMRLPARIRAILEILMSLIGIVILALMLWQMWEYAYVLKVKGQYTQIKEIIIWPYAYIMCAAATLFLTGVILYVRRGIWKFRHPDADTGRHDNDPLA